MRARSCRGMGLAEGVMVTFVSGLLLSVLPGFYLAQVRVWQRETGRLGAVQRADFVLRRMEEDVRNARRVSVSSDGKHMTIVLPYRAYDSTLQRRVNVLDATGNLIDGDQVEYYFVQDPDGTGSRGGAMYRRVTPAGGSAQQARRVTSWVFPALNPRGAGGSSPSPLFAYDPARRVITVTVTAAEPKPSTGTFAPTQLEPRCARDGGELVRVVTTQHLEGEIQCAICGQHVRPTAELATYQTRLFVRNQ